MKNYFLVLLPAVAVLSVTAASFGAEPPTRPNVVLIMADDKHG